MYIYILAEHVHAPQYLLFCELSYLSMGPIFCTPRCIIQLPNSNTRVGTIIHNGYKRFPLGYPTALKPVSHIMPTPHSHSAPRLTEHQNDYPSHATESYKEDLVVSRSILPVPAATSVCRTRHTTLQTVMGSHHVGEPPAPSLTRGTGVGRRRGRMPHLLE